jgi:hypothetical protein
MIHVFDLIKVSSQKGIIGVYSAKTDMLPYEGYITIDYPYLPELAAKGFLTKQ